MEVLMSFFSNIDWYEIWLASCAGAGYASRG